MSTPIPLDPQDLRWCLRRLPSSVKDLLKQPLLGGEPPYLAGGFIRSCISNEKINDIDLFVQSKDQALPLAGGLAAQAGVRITTTDNAFTVHTRPYPVQIIQRWTFNNPEALLSSFDFTIASACIFFDPTTKEFKGCCHPRFYVDLAAKRLTYLSPVREEEPGGSFLRLLKFYHRGFRVPLDSAGAIIARLVTGVNTRKIDIHNEEDVARVVSGLLREVDPNADPSHDAHLPSSSAEPVESHQPQ